MKSVWAGLVFGLVAASLGCSRATSNDPVARASGGGGGAGAAPSSAGTSSGPDLDPEQPGQDESLRIEPVSPVVTVVTGEPLPTLQLTARQGGAMRDVQWSLDRGELGRIDAAGVFVPSGDLGGVARVTARFGQLSATTTVTVELRTVDWGDPAWSAQPTAPGPGGFRGVGGKGAGAPPSRELRAALDAAPTLAPSVALLYPYDRTVFPQGMRAPLLQWHAGERSFDGVRLRISAEHYEYTGYFAANGSPFDDLPIPEAAWQAMTRSSGGKTLAVSLVFSQAGQAFGPYDCSWTIAPAVLRGTIYYNSYGTSYVQNSPYLDAYGKQFGAGTLAIDPGAAEPRLAAGIDSPVDGHGCRACHTVAGSGSFMVTQGDKSMGSDYSDTVAIDLSNDATQGAGSALYGAPSLAFPALSRDGNLLFSSSGAMEAGDSQSQLYAMPAATRVPDVSGLPSDFRATLPAFSPDTRHVSFNFWNGSFASGAAALTADRTSLFVLDFDGVSAFSNPRALFTPPSGAWPEVGVTFSSFLPDSSGVVFALQVGNKSQFWGYTWGENTSELWWVDLATAQPRRLDALNGLAANGAAYLPDDPDGTGRHPAARDVIVNYEPTVSPIAAGGYAWVVFTSRRLYGNVATAQPWRSDPRNYQWQDEVSPKKLWIAAIDLDAPPGTDPSHPAFYLPAQELYAGNSRGFWSFEPCRSDGAGCETGDQCCGGFCQRSADGALSCGSDVPACAADYDRCETSADCCDASAQRSACINQVCTAPRPPR